jgi:hypothetical protein
MGDSQTLLTIAIPMSQNSKNSKDSCTELTMVTTKLHTLNQPWRLWYHLPQDSDWSPNSYKCIDVITTLEQIIALQNSISENITKNCMLFIMKDGILPMWEDRKNRTGGCFSYKVTNKYVYDVWRELSYVLVGETISTNSAFVSSVNGITISPKKNFCIIKIWLNNCSFQDPSLVCSNIKGLISQGCLFKKHTPEF